jgi:hypothetical protein
MIAELVIQDRSGDRQVSSSSSSGSSGKSNENCEKRRSLRARGEWPCRSGADERDELTTFHC